MQNDAPIKTALTTVLNEIFYGPAANDGYVLNPGDIGLVAELEALDAETASVCAIRGGSTIAAHTDHIHYGLSLLNRWGRGEENPFKDADWNASWKRTEVSPEDWRSLIAKLRSEADEWRETVNTRTDWPREAAGGAIASAAHTAYHFGAIRQMIRATKAR